jgi:hypothetical protein
VLLSTDGPFDQVIKLKPPMVFSKTDADTVVSALTVLLAQLAASPQLQCQLAAAEDERAAAQIAPIANLYAENAAKIYAFAGLKSGGAGAIRAAPAAPAESISGSDDCSSSPLAAAPAAAGGIGGAAAAAGHPGATPAGKQGVRAATPAGKSLLRKVWSWASSRSDVSMSSAAAAEWEAAGGGSVAGASPKAVR